MTTYWLTKGGNYHFTLDCHQLRQAYVTNVVATEQEPPSAEFLCLSCVRRAGLPAGYAIGTIPAFLRKEVLADLECVGGARLRKRLMELNGYYDE